MSLISSESLARLRAIPCDNGSPSTKRKSQPASRELSTSLEREADIVGDLPNIPQASTQRRATAPCSQAVITQQGVLPAPLNNVELGNDGQQLSSSRVRKSNNAAGPAVRRNKILERSYSEASTPPLAVLKGLKRDYVALDRRSWLEVSDAKHRYGKNLREYYAHWCQAGKPGGSFFPWLTATSVELPSCSRSELDSDTVQYLMNEAERRKYMVRLQDNMLLHDSTGELISTGDSGWIFVLRDGKLLATQKRTTPPRFHHSSFYGGEYVEAAGMFVSHEGVLQRVYPHSGHYRPSDGHLYTLLRYLEKCGVDLHNIYVDSQRTLKIARPEVRTEQSSKKVVKIPKLDSAYLVTADHLLDFLSHKRKMYGAGVFAQLKNVAREFKRRRIESADSAYREHMHDHDMSEEEKDVGEMASELHREMVEAWQASLAQAQENTTG